ncbi:Conotoxin Pu5.3 [Frankliniella fusca]|uniref:Conotoxin Pu5.3 n=1 Tax=Frankliniella fusca TaxID=407009 RepID=A0AAE1HU40_9NEOP|nr:Conotoxin Pu5.3 [Frankliniella fusca]
MAVLVIFLALIASTAASTWTHPTGVLSDLSSFFSNLQENLESMENMTPEERRLVLGGMDNPHELLPQAGPGRPMSAPALMTSLRNQRPSSRTRHFVETSEPAALRRSNNHDPQLLWAGLGR